jgi:nitrite reductase/ring-hydroxylating ferredoxin subunit
VADLRIAVFQTAGGLRAVENCCSHVGNPIDDGPVSGEILTCPWHGWQYDLRTGHHLTVFGRRPGLRTFNAKVDGDDVLVDI